MAAQTAPQATFALGPIPVRRGVFVKREQQGGGGISAQTRALIESKTEQAISLILGRLSRRFISHGFSCNADCIAAEINTLVFQPKTRASWLVILSGAVPSRDVLKPSDVVLVGADVKDAQVVLRFSVPNPRRPYAPTFREVRVMAEHFFGFARRAAQTVS